MTDPLLDGDPTQIGPYRIHARLGGGGMGQVFLGRSPGGHAVAVKVVRPELAQDVDFRRRFATEVKAARKVGGFYTAQVVDADTDANPPWLATAYIPGPTLHRAVADHGPLPAKSVTVLGAGLAEGLTTVHAQGIVHRDLKPANVLLASDGPRLIDFGIARALDTTSHTHSSTVLGTAAFMSPEQARAQKVGPASDVFSLGCVLAFAATGRSPFRDGPVHAVVYRVVHEEPDLTSLPDALADLVGACLTKDPEARPDMEEILTTLTASTTSDQVRDGGQWLPDDLTEIITRRETLPTTLVANTRVRTPLEQGAVSRSDRAHATEACLRVGNLGPARMNVVLDGISLGSVPGGGSRTFTIAPGTHSLSVEIAGGRPSAPWPFEARAGGSLSKVFDVLPGREGGPRQVQEVTFTGSRGAGALMWMLIGGGLTGLGVLVTEVQNDGSPAIPLYLGVILVGIVVGGLYGVWEAPSRLILGEGGMKLFIESNDKGTIAWDDVEEIGVTGDGGTAVLKVRFRDGVSLPKQFKAGEVATCKASGLGVGDEAGLVRLRSALRWFADDAYTELPS